MVFQRNITTLCRNLPLYWFICCMVVSFIFFRIMVIGFTVIWQQLSPLLPNVIIFLTAKFSTKRLYSLHFLAIHFDSLSNFDSFSSCQCSKWKESILSAILRCSLIFPNIHIFEWLQISSEKTWMMKRKQQQQHQQIEEK